MGLILYVNTYPKKKKRDALQKATLIIQKVVCMYRTHIKINTLLPNKSNQLISSVLF